MFKLFLSCLINVLFTNNHTFMFLHLNLTRKKSSDGHALTPTVLQQLFNHVKRVLNLNRE